MNKTCARCEKTVYPTEELKCLDKVWHKGCFKCHECGMTLNMRTYKGYNKVPYCEAHIPKAKATTMAETPELKRIAENTKIQSNVKYHADFEKSKGKFTQVADDPETLRIKQNSKIISNVAYHGDLEKKAAMEQKRTINENGEYIEIPEDSENANAVAMAPPPPPVAQPTQQRGYSAPAATAVANAAAAIGKISDYDPMDQPRNSPYSGRGNQTVIYTSDRGAVTTPPSRKIGSIADIDPINNVYGSLSNPEYLHQRATANSNFNLNQNQYHHQQQHQQNHQQQHLQQQHLQQQQQHQQQQHQQQQHQQQQQQEQQHRQQMQQQQQQMQHQQMAQQHIQQMQQQQYQQQQQVAPPPQPAAATPLASVRVYRAMYDYESQDSDEVSFCEGDLIVNVSNIDSGWMTGTVRRTGDTGMLPANYVEVAHI